MHETIERGYQHLRTEIEEMKTSIHELNQRTFETIRAHFSSYCKRLVVNPNGV